MYGCPYCYFSWKQFDEVCDITNEKTKQAVMCDFEFEDCLHYQKAMKEGRAYPKPEKPPKHI